MATASSLALESASATEAASVTLLKVPFSASSFCRASIRSAFLVESMPEPHWMLESVDSFRSPEKTW